MTTSDRPVPTAETPRMPAGVFKLLLLVAVVGAGLFVLSVVRRVHQAAAVRADTREMAIPTVTVLHAKMSQSAIDVTLPGRVQPFYDAPIYARTNGYLKRWLVDIGTPVKEGQLLAEIETPEVDQQLNQAYAEREQAKANLALAKTTADRWQELLQKNAVAQQDTDERMGNLAAQQAALAAAGAEVARLEQLQSFKDIVAPFDGIVTARNTDVGELINSGGGVGQELFRVAQIGTLRVYVDVPETYAGSVSIGLPARLTLATAPGRLVEGKVTSTAKSIDPQSRTLLTEIQVPNPGGGLLPGSYAEVALRLPIAHPSLIVPINTILFRPDGPQIGVVDSRGVVTMKDVTIGHNFGISVEIVDGLKPGDSIILNPSDSLATGAVVRPSAKKEL